MVMERPTMPELVELMLIYSLAMAMAHFQVRFLTILADGILVSLHHGGRSLEILTVMERPILPDWAARTAISS